MSEPVLSIEERDRRYARVRHLMNDRQLDGLVFAPATGDWDNFQPDLRYMTCVGGNGMAAAGVFPMQGQPVVAVREARRVAYWRDAQEWVKDIRHPPGFRWARFIIDAMAEKGLGSGRIGIVGLNGVLREPEGTISHGLFRGLAEAFPKAHFESATDILYAARKCKSAEEIALMTVAQECAEAVSQALRTTARPGASEHFVYAEMVAAHIRAGGELPTMMLFFADKTMWQTQLAPRHRKLEHDDVIMIEADTKYFGYTSQAVDTVSLRKFTPEERNLLDISIDCFHGLREIMRPGRSYADIVREWGRFARQHEAVAGRTMGHGLGLGQDAPLTVPDGDGQGLMVEQGDCFVLKPWISDAQDTTSVRVGGLVVVEKGGARRVGRGDLEPAVIA
jgi:Xaa-Pro aminopeptidase